MGSGLHLRRAAATGAALPGEGEARPPETAVSQRAAAPPPARNSRPDDRGTRREGPPARPPLHPTDSPGPRPLQEVKSPSNAFQRDQLLKIFSVLGPPTEAAFPLLAACPLWSRNEADIQNARPARVVGLEAAAKLEGDPVALDLLRGLLRYDPNRRLSAAEALEHPYFQAEPLPGRNAFSERDWAQPKSPYPVRALLKEKGALLAPPGAHLARDRPAKRPRA